MALTLAPAQLAAPPVTFSSPSLRVQEAKSTRGAVLASPFSATNSVRKEHPNCSALSAKSGALNVVRYGEEASMSRSACRFGSSFTAGSGLQQGSSFMIGGSAGAELRNLVLLQAGGSEVALAGLGPQMNLFVRLARIVRAAIGGVVSANEDPEKIFEQATEEMGQDLAKLRQTSAQVVASQRLLENKYKAARTNSDQWYARAKKAMEKGDEGLAREALKRRKAFEDSAKTLQAQLVQQTAVADRIIGAAQALEVKLLEARSKKEQLKARAQSAKTSLAIQEMLGNINTSSALAAFERMEEKVLKVEAEADAINQITNDNLDTQFLMLESEDVGDELEMLRKEVNKESRPSWLEPPKVKVEGRDFAKELSAAAGVFSDSSFGVNRGLGNVSTFTENRVTKIYYE